ncbi:MAG: MaoC family dehydratase [Alphaproteobacteria bacterium]|nr:MaoC family dehydratase [Alphaproteobacteria bacterium]
MGLAYEDTAVGLSFDLGSYHFTREKILEFARRFDPQPFHVSDRAAANGPFGKLAASGWHTGAGWMKCYVATNQREEERLRAAGKPVSPVGPSPGFVNLKWLKPVYAGDTVSYRVKVTDKRLLASRPAWGMVLTFCEGFNQKGELVFSFEGRALTQRRQ